MLKKLGASQVIKLPASVYMYACISTSSPGNLYLLEVVYLFAAVAVRGIQFVELYANWQLLSIWPHKLCCFPYAPHGEPRPNPFLVLDKISTNQMGSLPSLLAMKV